MGLQMDEVTGVSGGGEREGEEGGELEYIVLSSPGLIIHT
jgi:hypothetical protein